VNAVKTVNAAITVQDWFYSGFSLEQELCRGIGTPVGCKAILPSAWQIAPFSFLFALPNQVTTSVTSFPRR